MERSVRGLLPFVLRDTGGQLAGFARVITDRATFGYIGDLFVLPEHRGRGLSKRLMEAIMAHPELQNFRRWMLATSDAHGLYEKFGFRPLAAPDILMERHDPNVYVPRN
jgi:GNAT superfamily N-acetyltransferase